MSDGGAGGEAADDAARLLPPPKGAKTTAVVSMDSFSRSATTTSAVVSIDPGVTFADESPRTDGASGATNAAAAHMEQAALSAARARAAASARADAKRDAIWPRGAAADGTCGYVESAIATGSHSRHPTAAPASASPARAAYRPANGIARR